MTKCPISFGGGNAESPRYFEISATGKYIYGLNNRMVLGTVREVTEQERNRQRSVDIAKLLNTVLKNLASYLFVKSEKNGLRYELCNETMCQFWHLREDEIIGHTDQEICPDTKLAEYFHKTDLQLLQDGKEQQFMEEYPAPDGSIRKIRLTKQRIVRSNGERLILGLGVDVTELENRRIEAEKANRAKSFFLANISHELRTPLNALIGFTDLLAEPRLPEATRQEYIRSVSYAANALLQLINDVLDLSKLEAQQMCFSAERTDFPAFCRQIFEIFAPRLHGKNLNAVQELPEMPPVMIDQPRIRQILFNLIGNAVKFTEHGEVRLQAAFHDNGDGTGKLTCSVIDTGLGISEADQKILFEPFVQSTAMRGTFAANSGTGLGLAISRRMIEKMGGTLTLQSQPGHGSTFTVTLPRLAIAAPEQQGNNPAPSVQPAQPDPEKRVLAVDDVEINRKVIAALLTRLKVPYDVADSGATALRMLRENRYHAVLTDLWMPEMDGAELLRQIRSIPGLQQLPVAAITADMNSGATFEISGFDAVLLKPLTLEKLRTLLLQIYHERKHISY